MSEQSDLSDSPPDSNGNAATAHAERVDRRAEREVNAQRERDAERERKKKRKNKVRSAWISFVGRIVAQFVGAAASIVLGLMFLQKYQATASKSGSGGNVKATAAAATPSVPVKERESDGHRSIAVLPFEHFSPDPKQEAIAGGMTEALIAGLAQTDSLHVISRTSSMHYKGLRLTLPEIGRELGVDLIVEGSVIRAGERVRIIVQLIDANTDEHVWAATYDRPFRNLLALQSDVARTIVSDLSTVAARGPEGLRSARRQRDGLVACDVSATPGCQPKVEERGLSLPAAAEFPAPSSTSTRRP